ncbi:MAG: glycosyltransferase family 2 protein [Clostridiaceae bacterium]|nr:glycosyltransferase family 2 protein [Clostridiaceae bacterium]
MPNRPKSTANTSPQPIPDISVLIPFYNESGQVANTVKTVAEYVCATGCSWEMVLIDDGSKDTTAAELLEAAADDPRLRVLILSRNFGKEAALCAALDHAVGRCAIIIDGDLQHPPEHIPEMVRLWREEGYEVVEGVKSNRGRESALKRLVSRGFYSIFRMLTGFDLQNASDFKLIDRKVIDAWKQMPEKNTFFRGMSAWLGFRRTSIKFEVRDRTSGISKWNLGALWRLSSNAITSFSSKPLRIINILGALFWGVALILGIQTLVNYIVGRAATGFTTVILLQLIIGGATMSSLSLLGRYVTRIYDESKDRPRYLITRDFRAATASPKAVSTQTAQSETVPPEAGPSDSEATSPETASPEAGPTETTSPTKD